MTIFVDFPIKKWLDFPQPCYPPVNSHSYWSHGHRNSGFSHENWVAGRVYPCISQDKNNWGLRWPDRRKTVVEFTAYWNLQIKDRSDWRKVTDIYPMIWIGNSDLRLEKESQRCFNAKNFMLISSDGSTCFSWGLFRGGWCLRAERLNDSTSNGTLLFFLPLGMRGRSGLMLFL